MNDDDFIDRYPTLSGYFAGDFPYSTDRPDEETARRIAASLVKDGGPADVTLRTLISEAETLLPNLNEQWGSLSRIASREFDNSERATRWLQTIIAIWKSYAQAKP